MAILTPQQQKAMGYKYDIYTGQPLSTNISATPAPTLPITPTLGSTQGSSQNSGFSNTFSPAKPSSTGTPYVPEAIPSVNPSDLIGGIRAKLSSGEIDGETAKQMYSTGLAQQYGADVKFGSPQFTNFAAQDAYQKAMAKGYGNVFGGLGDVKYGTQYGEYSDMGNFQKKSTEVRKSVVNVSGVDNSTQALKGPLTASAVDYKSTLPTVPKLG